HSEKHSGASYRTLHNAQWLKNRKPLREAINRAGEGPAAPTPLFFDLRLGNLCNLKCTVCKPLYSSQIERDAVHSAWVTTAPHARLSGRFGDDGEWSQAPILVDEITGLSDNVEAIQLAGGEPTINHTHMGWLRRLCEQGKAKDIDLLLVTNLSNVRDDVL